MLSLLLVADMVAYYCYRISLRGYYSDVLLFWSWLLGSFAIIVLYWKKILAKLLLGAMVLAVVLSILPMAVPFYALVFSTTPLGLWLNKDLHENYRAQIVGYSVMVPPILQVIAKKGLLEQQVFQCSDADLHDEAVRIRHAKDILWGSETDSTLELVLFYGGPDKRVVFDKRNGKIK